MLAECDGESDDDSDSDFEVASFKEHAVAIFRSGATMSSWKASLYKGDNTEGQYRSNPWRSFRRDGINWKFSSLKALGAEWANSANPNIAETEFELSGQGSISEHLADLITDA